MILQAVTCYRALIKRGLRDLHFNRCDSVRTCIVVYTYICVYVCTNHLRTFLKITAHADKQDNP